MNPRLRVALVTAVVVAIALAIVLAIGSGSEDPGDSGPIFEDDFSSAGEPWNLDNTNDEFTRQIVGGRYYMGINVKDGSISDSVGFDSEDAVVVSAVAAIGGLTEGAGLGLRCAFSDSPQESPTGLFGDYEATIYIDGRTTITRELTGNEEVLFEETAPGARPVVVPFNLKLTCRFTEDQATIELSENGRTVATATDNDPLSAFNGAGMTATTKEAGLRVSFDDFTVTRAGDDS